MKLIFCHIGSPLPSHLIENILRTRKLFPNLPIHLIKSHEFNVSQELCKIPQLGTFDLENINEYQELLRNSTLDLNFRRGFWRATLERLFAISAHAMIQSQGPFLHIESDVLLMKTFPFAELQTNKNPTWSFYNELRDVASLLYLPSSETAQWLLLELKRELSKNPSHTDMTILKSVSQSNPNIIRYFPMGMSFLRNENSTTAFSELESINSRTIEIDGIFDSAAIGMWLTGMDPRNNYGHTKYFDTSFIDNGDSWIDPSKLKFDFEKKYEVYVVSPQEGIPIHSLHVHSKDVSIFQSEDLNNCDFVAYYKHGTSSMAKFSFSTFVSLLRDSIESGSVLRFFAFAPGFRVLSTRILQLRDSLIKRVKRD